MGHLDSNQDRDSLPERCCVLASRDRHVIEFVERRLRERGMVYWRTDVVVPAEDARLKSRGVRIDVREDDLEAAKDIAAEIIARRARQKTIPSQHEDDESPPGSTNTGYIGFGGL